MSALLLKLLLIPTVIGAVTLASRRWGATVGGWLSSLPWVAGPILLFLTLEQGTDFAAQAALNALAVVLGLVGFCVAYLLLVSRFGWFICSVAGFVTYLLLAMVMSWVMPLNIWLVFGIAIGSIYMAIRLFPVAQVATAVVKAPPFDIPLRMVVATGFVVVVTVLAQVLGVQWSGLLTPFPVMTSILAIFTHYQQGPEATIRIIRGLGYGLFGFATFLLVVCLMLTQFSVFVTFAVAFVAAILINMLTFRWIRA
ncbi:MAG: hypothetical protein U0Y10_10855 [Spirosomataceae bacterium]